MAEATFSSKRNFSWPIALWEIKGLIKGNQDDFLVALNEVIQSIRNDLAVVEGNNDHNHELFTCTPYDKYKLMTNL